MASNENTWESQEPRHEQQKMKLRIEYQGKLFEEVDSSDRVDSGIGNSLVSIPSDGIDTNSNSMDDESRDQKCMESAEIKFKKLQLSDGDTTEKCESIDDGYKSITQEKQEESFTLPSNSPNYPSKQISVHDCMRCFAQTQDLRYVLAPFWPSLLNQNDDGDTPLHLAIINCNGPTINQIIDVLPRPECFNIYNDLTQTPLHLAVITRQDKIVGKLIDRGASVDLVDRNGQTCVHLACERGDLKTLREIFKPRPGRRDLQEKLPEILETRNFDGLTPLCVAVKANHIEVVKELITLGSDVDAPDSKSGNTALHLAVEDNNLSMVACLLFQGNANPNAMSYSDNTPLHLAAGLELETIVATLIAMGASGSIENMEGDTAFRIASESDEDCKDKDFPDKNSLEEVGFEEMEN